MPGMFRTAAAFLLIFGCMASASAASVRAEEQMEIQTAMKAEGTTAQTMTGTAGGANEQVIRSSRYIIPSTRPQDNLITA